MTAKSGARRIVIDALPGPGQHHRKWFEPKALPAGLPLSIATRWYTYGQWPSETIPPCSGRRCLL